VILIDTTVWICAAGQDHPNRASALVFLEAVARGNIDAATDAGVLQEILNHYRTMGRWEEGRRVYNLARRIVPDVLPIDATALDRARALLDAYQALTPRDALHAAVALEQQAAAICSYDEHMDVVDGLIRVTPDEGAPRPRS
jgi:predicted nucleic acid-binding protein